MTERIKDKANLVPRVLSYPPTELRRADRKEPWERGWDKASHSSPLCFLLSERPHFLPRNTRVHACSQWSRVADPDLQIRGGGVSKFFFSPEFGLKIRGSVGLPGPLP